MLSGLASQRLGLPTWQAWRLSARRICRAEPALYAVQPLFWGSFAAMVSPLGASVGCWLMAWITTPKRPWLRLWLMLGFAALALRAGWMAPLSAPEIPGMQWARVDNFAMRQKPAACPATSASRDRLLLRLPSGHPCPYPGTALQWRGKEIPAASASNPGGFDEIAWLQSQGIIRVMQVDSFRILGSPTWPWRAALSLRDYLLAAYERHVPAPALALVLSTVLGDMSGLSRNTKRDFQNTGMMHILAISGQHIALMAAIGIQAFRMARLPQRVAYAAIAFGLAFYGPATGWSPSVVRSIAMFWLILPAILLRRPHSPWTTFAASMAISLFFEPTALLQVGWQLSYLATLTLLLHIRPSENAARYILPPRKFPGTLCKILRLGIAAVVLSFAVTLGTLPIIASFSHVIMPIAPLANLITVPLGSGLLTSAFLTAAFSPVPVLGDWLGEATGFFALGLEKSVGLLAKWQSGLIALPPWPLPVGLAWVTGLLLWPFFTARLRFRIALAALLFAAGLHSWKSFNQSWRQPVAATVLDVGQGQAVLVEMGDQIILLDAGPAMPDAGLRAILPALRAQGWNKIDLVLLSHGDADHIGGLVSLVQELPIGRVALGGPWPEEGLWPDLASALRRKAIPFGALNPGQTILRSGLWELRTIDLGLNQSGHAISRNDGSAVVVLEGPTGRLLIPGDIGKAPKRILADTVLSWSAHGPSRPLWLVIPHHGSDRTGDMPALTAMQPDIALISAGKKNKFGHPGPNTMATLQGMGAKILLTPRHGALSLAADQYAARWTTALGM